MLYCLREMGCMMAKPSGENLYQVIAYVQLLGKDSSDGLIKCMMLIFNCLQMLVHLINIVVLSRKGGIACFPCETVLSVRDSPGMPKILELRPYKRKSTGSRLISAVKPVMALSVLWWGTTWEYRVL